MKKWIARWFGILAEPDAASTEPATCLLPGAAPGAPPCEARPAHADDIDTVFYRWLCGPDRHDAPPATEKLILDELARLARSPEAGADLVPRVPAVIPQLLRSLRDDSMSGADLSRQLAQDVVLVAEVIREANSPYYRPAAPVRSIEGAIMLLGQNGMRLLLARVAFRPIISMQSGQFARLLAPRIWSQSEKCALAGHLLAPGLGANPFEAYLAGLLQNVGLIVALRLIDQIYSGEALPQSDRFCAGLLSGARTLSAGIARLWDFPVTVSDAIQTAGMPDASALAEVLARSDRIAKLRLLADGGQFDADQPFALPDLTADELACFEKLKNEED